MRLVPLSLFLVGSLCACAGQKGDPGDPGQKGDPGPKGDPGAPGVKGDPGPVSAALTLLTPEMTFSARAGMELQISGTGTHFQAATTAKFDDPGITVNKVEVGSQGNLRIDVSVSEQTKFGLHDLTVSTKGAGPQGADEVPALKGGLNVAPALIADMSGNEKSVVQGGFADIAFFNVDLQNPLGSDLRMTSGLTLYSTGFTGGDRYFATGIVDALAPVGGLGLVIMQSRPPLFDIGYVSDTADANAPQVTARTPVALTVGTAKTGESLPAARTDNLYKFTTTADEQVMVLKLANVGAPLAGAGILTLLAPPSGKFSEGHYGLPLIAGGTGTTLAVMPKMGDYYVAVFPRDLSGAMTYTYDVTVQTAAAKKLPSLVEPAGGDSATKPLLDFTLDQPSYGLDGAIDQTGDVDYIRFKTTKAGKIYIEAVSTGSPFVPAVTLAQGDCTTITVPARLLQQEFQATAGTPYCAQVNSFGTGALPYRLILSGDL